MTPTRTTKRTIWKKVRQEINELRVTADVLLWTHPDIRGLHRSLVRAALWGYLDKAAEVGKDELNLSLRDWKEVSKIAETKTMWGCRNSLMKIGFVEIVTPRTFEGTATRYRITEKWRKCSHELLKGFDPLDYPDRTVFKPRRGSMSSTPVNIPLTLVGYEVFKPLRFRPAYVSATYLVRLTGGSDIPLTMTMSLTSRQHVIQDLWRYTRGRNTGKGLGHGRQWIYDALTETPRTVPTLMVLSGFASRSAFDEAMGELERWGAAVRVVIPTGGRGRPRLGWRRGDVDLNALEWALGSIDVGNEKDRRTQLDRTLHRSLVHARAQQQAQLDTLKRKVARREERDGHVD